MEWIDNVLRDVAELPDRNSPEDWPEAMLVTGDELRQIIVTHAPAEPVNARLLDVAVWPAGYCRDPNGKMSIPAGKEEDFNFGYDVGFQEAWEILNSAISAAGKSPTSQQERLLQDMHDAGREVDRVMAEAAPKAVRLTLDELDAAAKEGGKTNWVTLFQRIETAVLRKNGIEVRRYQAEVEQFRADARRFRIAEKNLFDVQEAAKIIAKQAIAAEAERDALAAKLKEVDGRIDDLLATCHRLALELECLLLDTKDSAPVSRWWDSAMAALDGWHKAKDAASARPVPAEPVNARLLDALKLAECVYRKNVVNEGEPSSVLEAMQAAITAAEAQRQTDYSSTVDRAWARFCGAFGDGPDAPYPGMIAAFEIHYGQSFRDKAWRTEAACWAAAWHKVTEQAAKINPPTPRRMKPTDFDGEMFAFDHALAALDQALHEADLPYVTELSVRSTCLRRLAAGEWRMAKGEWLQLINELTGVNPNDHQATRP